MNKILFFISILLQTSQLLAQVADWSTGVAPILYNKCASCHHAGGAGHRDFTNYDTAVAFAGSVYYYTTQGIMPPWPPNPTYRTYAHERRLSNQEILTIQSWVNNGTLLGDTSLAPPKPIFNGSAMLTQTPDYIFSMPTYTITPLSGSSDDIYWNFVLPTNFLQQKFIQGFEFIPGNTAHVHHALIFSDTSQAVLNADNAYPGIGYPGFGGTGSSTSKLLGAYVPGSTPFLFPQGFGQRLPANSYLIFNIHYPFASAGSIDSSKIHLFLANGSVREVFFSAPLNHGTTITNGPLALAANTTKTFEEKYTVPIDISAFGVAPHMHLIGRNIRVKGTTPAGDSIPIIDIPKWDFKWQGAYYFRQVQKIPAGTELVATAFYDNTTANPYNPNSPPQYVAAGEDTDEEMMLVYFAYTNYQNGDENILMDTAFVTTSPGEPLYADHTFFDPFPNPTTQQLHLKWYTRDLEEIQLELIDLSGRHLLSEIPMKAHGYQYRTWDLSSLPSGIYMLQMRSSTSIRSFRIQIKS